MDSRFSNEVVNENKDEFGSDLAKGACIGFVAGAAIGATVGQYDGDKAVCSLLGVAVGAVAGPIVGFLYRHSTMFAKQANTNTTVEKKVDDKVALTNSYRIGSTK